MMYSVYSPESFFPSCRGDAESVKSPPGIDEQSEHRPDTWGDQGEFVSSSIHFR